LIGLFVPQLAFFVQQLVFFTNCSSFAGGNISKVEKIPALDLKSSGIETTG